MPALEGARTSYCHFSRNLATLHRRAADGARALAMRVSETEGGAKIESEQNNDGRSDGRSVTVAVHLSPPPQLSGQAR